MLVKLWMRISLVMHEGVKLGREMEIACNWIHAHFLFCAYKNNVHVSCFTATSEKRMILRVHPLK